MTIIRSGTCVRSSIRATQGIAVDLAVFRVDELDRPGKPRLAQVPQHRSPERALARACADERDRARLEDLFEAVGAHETVFPWTVDPTSVCAFSAVGMRCLKAQQPVP